MPNTVPAAGEAMADRKALEGFRDLEDAICRAHNMAVTLDDLLDLKFCKRDHGRWVADLSKENMEALCFVWKEMRILTGAVMDQFYAVDEEDQAND